MPITDRIRNLSTQELGNWEGHLVESEGGWQYFTHYVQSTVYGFESIRGRIPGAYSAIKGGQRRNVGTAREDIWNGIADSQPKMSLTGDTIYVRSNNAADIDIDISTTGLDQNGTRKVAITRTDSVDATIPVEVTQAIMLPMGQVQEPTSLWSRYLEDAVVTNLITQDVREPAGDIFVTIGNGPVSALNTVQVIDAGTNASQSSAISTPANYMVNFIAATYYPGAKEIEGVINAAFFFDAPHDFLPYRLSTPHTTFFVGNKDAVLAELDIIIQAASVSGNAPAIDAILSLSFEPITP